MTGRVVSHEQWKADCEHLLTAAMYGNPPGGWSDPVRRQDFVDRTNEIERRLRDAE